MGEMRRAATGVQRDGTAAQDLYCARADMESQQLSLGSRLAPTRRDLLSRRQGPRLPGQRRQSDGVSRRKAWACACQGRHDLEPACL